MVTASIKMVEEPSLIDEVLLYNSFVNMEGKEDFYRFHHASVYTIITVVCLFLVFGGLIAYSIWRESQPGAHAEHTADLRRLYTADGGIEAFAYPHSVHEHVSCA